MKGNICNKKNGGKRKKKEKGVGEKERELRK
jgi:hypothetical protein